MDPEKAVREAAAALHASIGQAAKAGFVVQWPRNAAGLMSIGIGQTAKAKPAAPAEAKGGKAPAGKS